MNKVKICKCLLCGKENIRGLGLHIRSHKITLQKYLQQFPDAEISNPFYDALFQKEQKEKYHIGKKRSNKTRENISNALKGNIPWNKDLTKETDKRVRKNAEATSKAAKEILFESNVKNYELRLEQKVISCICLICGKKNIKHLAMHLKYNHKIRVSGYLFQFPNAQISNPSYSEEAKQKINSKKRGKTYEEIYGVEKAIELKNKKSELRKGKTWEQIYGIEKTKIAKQAVSNASKGRIPKSKGKTKYTDEGVAKRAKNIIGSGNPNWQNGISKEPYSFDFTKELKEQIKERDNYICQLCGEINKKKLVVHHIDYNKKNSNPDNLLTLCNRCNLKVNARRIFWVGYFIGRMIERKNSQEF